MKAPLLAGLACLLACASVHAGRPSEAVVDACLKLESVGTASFVELDTTEQRVEEDESRQTKATYFQDKGKRFGYEERRGKGALIWQRKRVQLSRAVLLEGTPEKPATFLPGLAAWGRVKSGRQQYLCANFNFDGLGQSGSFQRVHGLYLMPLPSKAEALHVYFGVREDKP